jgi:hypothetical protein
LINHGNECKISGEEQMALTTCYPGILSRSVIFAIVILLLTFGTPAAAQSFSNSSSGYFHGISYGYSVNLKSTSIPPVIETTESQGISVFLFSPALAGSGYRGNYLTANPGSAQALIKKFQVENFGKPQKSSLVPPDYLLPVFGSENIQIATSIDYVDVTNQRIHVES